MVKGFRFRNPMLMQPKISIEKCRREIPKGIQKSLALDILFVENNKTTKERKPRLIYG